MNNTANTIKSMLSTDLTIRAFDFLACENKEGLYQIGLNDEAIDCLMNMENKDISLAITAFEQALSIQTYVDPNIIKRVIVHNSKMNKELLLFNNLVKCGASFEMIRYFINSYTNRRHTSLRQEFEVNDLEINKTTIAVPTQTADDFFGSFLLANKSINAQDILTFAKDNKYSMNSIWRELKIFVKNGI
jgi:hypothetical protein